MQADKRARDQLWELQGMITKMPLMVCCTAALPEFGVRWKEVSRKIRNCRLPMQSSSVAQVLCRYIAKSLPEDELSDILTRLRLKMVSIQPRTWHVIHLHEPTDDEPVAELLQSLPQSVHTALQRRSKGGAKPEVNSVMMGDMIYLAVQFVSHIKKGPVLYIAVPPGQPVALISSLAGDKLLKACVEGLGYASYTRSDLSGADASSLVRVARGAWGPPAAPGPYRPAPAPTANGIDYTHAHYDEQYLDSVIGPNPPLLTELTVKTAARFHPRACLDKPISLTLRLRSASVAASFRAWVARRALQPDCDLIRLLQTARANTLTYNREDSD